MINMQTKNQKNKQQTYKHILDIIRTTKCTDIYIIIHVWTNK